MSRSTGGAAVQRRRPESNSAPGPAHSMVGILKNLSKGAFHYETLESSSTPSIAGSAASSSKAQLEDHHHQVQVQVQCSCGPFLGFKAKQKGRTRNRSKVSSGLKVGGIHETPAAGFLFKLLASYEWLRESVRTTNLNVYDLFVGNQMFFLMTASPIPRGGKAKAIAASPGCDSSRRLGMIPVTSGSSLSNSTPGQKLPDVRIKSSKSFPCSRGCDSNADRRLLSYPT
ncbi:unnamed protein product [Calypogeia fissa]